MAELKAHTSVFCLIAKANFCQIVKMELWGKLFFIDPQPAIMFLLLLSPLNPQIYKVDTYNQFGERVY